MKKIIIFCALLVPSLSAPNGCTTSCRTYSNSQQQTADLDSLSQQLTAELGSSQLNFDSSRLGNWTEQDHYRTDGGHGQVHEERGQYVQGPKRIRFFKKNYTSSYSSGGLGGLESANLGNANNYGGYDASQLSQATTNLGSSHFLDQSSNLETSAHESTYGALHGQQSSRRVGSHSERLEDFGELSGNAQVSQHGISGFDSQIAQGQDTQSTYGLLQPDSSLPGNWSKVDSYRTDGGNGKVYEEQGQVVTGPKRIRYYRKNYTSSYTSNGSPNMDLGVSDLEREIQQWHKQYDSFGREIHQSSSSNIHSDNQDPQNTGTTYGNNRYRTGTVRVSNNDLINSNSQALSQGTLDIDAPTTNYGQRTSETRHHQVTTTRERVLNSNSDGYNYNVDNQQGSQNYWRATTPRPVITLGQSGHQQVSSSESYGSRTQQNYQNSYGSEDQQISQTASHSPNRGGQQPYAHSPVGNNYGQHQDHTSQDILQSQVDQSQHSQLSSLQQSEYNQGQISTANVDQGGYIPNIGQASTTRPGRIRHYEQYWSSSSHHAGGSVPDIGTANLQVDDSQQTQQVTQQHSGRIESTNQQSSYDILHGHNTNVGENSQNYNYAYATRPGKLTTGILDLGQNGQSADCHLAFGTTGQASYGSQYRRMYKRGTAYQQGQNLNKQSNKFDDLTQENEDLTQQNEDLTQQAASGIVFGQQTQHNLEPDQFQVGNQHAEDLTQQSEDFTQQVGNLELEPQQSAKPGKLQVGNQQVEDLIQQNEDLTQQAGGFEDFTQQTSGKIELGQQQSSRPGKLEIENLETDDLTQQTGGFDDFTQQTSGKIEFGQQTQQSRKPGKLQVQNQDSDDLTQKTGGFDDFTQQTSGSIEFGQQSNSNKFQIANQETDELHEQTDGFDDLTQQTSGKVELGQLHRQPSTWRPGPLQVGNQAAEDLTQQPGEINDFAQQTSGKIEFGQQSQSFGKPGNFKPASQDSDDLIQQTGGFEDFTQQTSGNVEFGQEPQSSWNIGKLQVGNQQTEDLPQQNEDPQQKTSGFEDFTQYPFASFGNGQQTEQFGLNQQSNGRQPTPKSTLPWRHPKPDKINYAQQGELHQETTGDLQSEQKRDQLNYAQQNNVQWESTHDIQQVAKEIVHGQENVNNDNKPVQVIPEPDPEVDIGTESIILRGDQPQAHPKELAKKTSEVEKPQSNSDVPQQGTVTTPRRGHRPGFVIQHYNGNERHQSGSEWHYSHNVGDLTDSEGPRLYPHQTSTVASTIISSNGQINYEQSSPNQQSLGNEQQSHEINIDQEFGEQQNTEDLQQYPSQLNFNKNSEDEKDFNDFQQQTGHITFGSGAQHQEHSSEFQQQSSQLNFNKNSDKQKDDDDFDQQSSHIIYESGAHQQNPDNLEDQITQVSVGSVSQKSNVEQLYQQYGENNFGQQKPEILDLTQQTNSNFQTFEKDVDQQSGFQQHTGNIELGQQFQYGQDDTDDLQQQSSRFEIEKDIDDQTSQIEQKSVKQNDADLKIEPRILEAYGGGSLDSIPSRDIYNNVRTNPSATLAPYAPGADSWIIREKPREIMAVSSTRITTTTTEESQTEAPESTTDVPHTTETTVRPPSSIWGKLGKKLSNTYEKAKNTAVILFG